MKLIFVRRLFAAILAFLPAAVTPAAKAQGNAASRPAPEVLTHLAIYRELLQQARRQGRIDLLFVGDSITEYWRMGDYLGYARGREVWDKVFVPLHAANFGSRGYRTQNGLWRIEDGALDGLTPKLVVLMIGTNNLSAPESPQKKADPDRIAREETEAAVGVAAVATELRSRLPGSKILLLGIFPRGQRGSPIRSEIRWVNARLAKLDDGELYPVFGHRSRNSFIAGRDAVDGHHGRPVPPDHTRLRDLGGCNQRPGR